jgi:hypothetical protein
MRFIPALGLPRLPDSLTIVPAADTLELARA